MRNNLVKCGQCDLNFLSREGMEKHTKRVHAPKENNQLPRTRFKCENCDEEFTTKLDFKKHRDPQKLLCKKCQEDKKKFICENKCELIKHVRKMHKRDLMMKKQNIIESRKLEKTMQKKQLQVKNFTPRHACVKCNKVFKDNNFLELHMREEHSNKQIKKERIEGVKTAAQNKRILPKTGSIQPQAQSSIRARITKINSTSESPAKKANKPKVASSSSSSKPKPKSPKRLPTAVPSSASPMRVPSSYSSTSSIISSSTTTTTTTVLTMPPPTQPLEPNEEYYYKTFTAEELIKLGVFTEASPSLFVPPLITGDLDSDVGPEALALTDQPLDDASNGNREVEPPNSLDGVFILGL